MRLYFMLAFVLGVGAGIGLTAVLVPGLDDGIQDPLQATPAVSAQPNTALIRSLQGALQEAENALEAEIQKSTALQEEISSLSGRLEVELVENEDQLNADAAQAERRRERFENAIANRSQRRLEAYKRAANLRPDQEAALESIMEQYTAYQLALRDARRNDTEPPPELDLDQLLATILDPVQVESVQSYRDEVRQGRNETRATATMNRIAPSLGLNEEQKDAVFQIYYGSLSENAEISSSNERLARQMQNTLTPEQYEEWQRLNPD